MEGERFKDDRAVAWRQDPLSLPFPSVPPCGDFQKEPEMRIQIDRDLCIGAGSCVKIAPGVFQLDEEHKARVVAPNDGDEDAIWEAAQNCPTTAIILQDAAGKQLYP